MRQQILENYIYFVFKLLIFFPLLRNTCGPLPTIPHYSFPNFVLPPVCLYQEDERPLSGTLQSSKFSVFSCNNHNKYSFFWYISLPLHLSVCLSSENYNHKHSAIADAGPVPIADHVTGSSLLLTLVPSLAWVPFFIGCSPLPQTRRVSGCFPEAPDR